MSAAFQTMRRTIPAGVAACLLGFSAPGNAQEMTAGSLAANLSSDERFAYLAGVIEGLAYARYARDGNSTTGMGCVYRWFYETPDTLRNIYATFDRFPDHTPGAVIAAMVEKDCP